MIDRAGGIKRIRGGEGGDGARDYRMGGMQINF